MSGVDDTVDRYLNELCWAMGGSFSEQQAVRDELRAHIRDNARELELGGLAHDDAIIAALGDLGPADDVGRAMRSSRGTLPLRKPLTQLEGALILERRTIRNLPPLPVLFSLAALLFAILLVGLVYAWP